MLLCYTCGYYDVQIASTVESDIYFFVIFQDTDALHTECYDIDTDIDQSKKQKRSKQ